MRTILSGLGLLTAGILWAAASQASTIGYTLTPLVGTQGDGTSFANAINNVGQVAGDSYSHLSDFPPFPQSRATLWNGTMAADLGTLGGTASFASDINDAGQVAGSAETATEGNRATLWNGVTATELGRLVGSFHSRANAINNVGQIAGYSFFTTDNPLPPLIQIRATLWNGTMATALGTLGGTDSFASDINNTSQVAGWAQTSAGGPRHATVWDGSKPTDLGTLGGTDSRAHAINDAGQVAGDSFINNNQDFHATVWDGTKPTDLGTLSGGTSSSALAINNAGQIVGYSWTTDAGTDPIGTPTTHAILWNGTTMTDLNSLLDPGAVSEGWTVFQATGINDQGWIVGDAIKFGQRAAVLLIPIPEPETYALMLTGLGLIGFMVRHKKSEVRI